MKKLSYFTGFSIHFSLISGDSILKKKEKNFDFPGFINQALLFLGPWWFHLNCPCKLLSILDIITILAVFLFSPLLGTSSCAWASPERPNEKLFPTAEHHEREMEVISKAWQVHHALTTIKKTLCQNDFRLVPGYLLLQGYICSKMLLSIICLQGQDLRSSLKYDCNWEHTKWHRAVETLTAQMQPKNPTPSNAAVPKEHLLHLQEGQSQGLPQGNK